MKNMKKVLNELLDWIYKKKCYFCRSSKDNTKMCKNCFDELEYLEAKAHRVAEGSNIYCAGLYEDSLQKLIRGLKYHKQTELAHFQALFMHNYWKKISDKNVNYQVVAVPLFRTREKQRGYNHMHLVAQEFCKLSGYELNTQLVQRCKDTKAQYKLNRAQRMENLKNAFEINSKNLKNDDILIIDDICTTGSTFENIIKELRNNDVENKIVCLATTTPFSN